MIDKCCLLYLFLIVYHDYYAITISLNLFVLQTQAVKRDLSGGQNFIAPVLREKQVSVEETVSARSNSDLNLPSLRSTSTSSIQESPKLYQNYGKESTA